MTLPTTQFALSKCCIVVVPVTSKVLPDVPIVILVALAMSVPLIVLKERVAK